MDKIPYDNPSFHTKFLSNGKYCWSIDDINWHEMPAFKFQDDATLEIPTTPYTNKELEELEDFLREVYYSGVSDSRAPTGFEPEHMDKLKTLIDNKIQEAYRNGYNDNARDCTCDDVSYRGFVEKVPHHHLMDDGKSHDIRPPSFKEQHHE